jgi:PAS domain S-box-containing protein
MPPLQVSRVACDEYGLITDLDDSFLKLVGVNASALEDCSLLEITHEADRRRNLDLLIELRHTGSPFTITKRYVRSDGRALWVHNHVRMIRRSRKPVQLLASIWRLSPPDDKGGTGLFYEKPDRF